MPDCLGAVAAALGPIVWNGILRAAHGDQFFTDAQISVFPVSWQHTGSDVFTPTAAALLLAAGPLRASPSSRLPLPVWLPGLAALAVDVYLY